MFMLCLNCLIIIIEYFQNNKFIIIDYLKYLNVLFYGICDVV